jgi:hypothetical protein
MKSQTENSIETKLPRVACIMMQRDEEDLIRQWVSYHANLFGIDNLFIFDNGSMSPLVTRYLRDLESQGLNVEWSRTGADDYHRKGELIGSLIRSLADRYDLFFPLDCDEFLVLKIGKSEIKSDRENILGALSEHRGSTNALRVNEAFYNILGYPDWFWCWPHQKTFFAKSFEYLDHGYHNGRTASGLSESTSIIYLHYHHKPHVTMVQHAKNKLAPYVDVENKELLSNYQGTAQHCVKAILDGEERYMSQFNTKHAVRLPNICNMFANLRVPVPFI